MGEKSRNGTVREWTGYFMDKGKVSYEVASPFALFADPVTSTGGEKCSMEIPSNEALKGFTKNIFWKPCITWYIDRVRIMNPIRMTAVGQKLTGLRGEMDLAYYTYLTDVRYQVEAHFEFNRNRPEYAEEWSNPVKYYSQFAKALLAEGRYSPFLGKSECVPSYIRPCAFGEGSGYYDKRGSHHYGYLYYGLTYPDEAYDSESAGWITLHLYDAVMENGIVEYPLPAKCLHRKIRQAMPKTFRGKGDRT